MLTQIVAITKSRAKANNNRRQNAAAATRGAFITLGHVASVRRTLDAVLLECCLTKFT